MNALRPSQTFSSGKADGVRASKLEHPVQRMNGNRDLGRAALVRPRTQCIRDPSFQPANRGLSGWRSATVS
jgi:hypothetical protein